ncbi:unnamed protein product [Callosobruchus maculatus]|uniref:Pericentriolar material 1 protein C-terminal domain-containing protein n=1 Tax=Callosobruchus maculatus TaxID=64391 RepID=A0A653BM41_CALMS|nr:unnamed protein product [Callosobruchus maculatus]
MSDDGRKTNKHYTGTVPKVRQRNNISPFRDQENLPAYWIIGQHASDPSRFTRNPRRNQQNNYFTMNSTIEENGTPQQNGCTNMSVNGSPSTSLTTSRRNSSGSTLKCDNVSKYPDKKQIEDKLHQIREYLKLMTTMKNTDEQASENEVEEVTEFNPHSNRKNDINLENARQEAEFLKEQQLTLLQLQQKAENKLRDARKLTGNWMILGGPEPNGVSNTTATNGYADFDVAIRELEEKTKTLGPTAMTNKKMQENILARVESLHNQIVTMHDANEEREKLIEALDTRDAELRQQQAELHSKLVELQNKKSQVDQLVTQLQTFTNEEEQEDIGVKVRNIVAMKDQLNKLQDMLEVVKSAETTINPATEAQAVSMDTCLNIESILEKDNQKPKLRSTMSNDSNVLRYDNDTSSEGRNKQTNKNKKDQRLGGQKSALQSELEIKKRELEELMGKHKASTSNLNHDVGLDIKSEFSYNSNTVNEAWPPVTTSHHHQTDSDRFSSDDCVEDDDYPLEEDDPLGSRNEGSASSPAPVNCCPSKYRAGSIGAASDRRGGAERRREDRNVRSGSVPVPVMASMTPPSRHHLRNRSNSDKESKTQVHKQLQLIKSVCESMLEQDRPAPVQAPSGGNVRQLRNDLTPSPLYSAPPNVAVPLDAAWIPPPNGGGDGYQGWLTTNAIQTQSFLLSTLNQCCQMLWLQQRELAALRSAVTVLQERLEGGQYVPPAAAPLDQHHMPTSLPPEVHRSTANLYRYGGSGAKTNQAHQQQQQQQQVSAAFSMPNLNQYAAASPHPHHVDSPAQVPPYAPQVPHHGLNNHQELPNNAVLAPPANHMWLNNQIAPGNRANNYWDNFRSYSRQNLLSTKNCEVPQSSPSVIDRSNANERTNPFSLMAFSKCNSDQDSTSTSHENTPQRKRHDNIPPPDVLNVNQNTVNKSMEHLDFRSNEPSNRFHVLNPVNTVKSMEHVDLRSTESTNRFHVLNPVNTVNKSMEHLDLRSNEPSNRFHVLNPVNTVKSMEHVDLRSNEPSNGFHVLNPCSVNDTSSIHSNLSEDQMPKDCFPEQYRRRNEWNDEANDESFKGKLFEELRENVYKEVASLISANETRPHFLIQLFRDLKMIGNDNLRLKILQSIQTVITHSNPASQNQNTIISTESHETSQSHSDLDTTQSEDNFTFQTTVWGKAVKNKRRFQDPTEYVNFVGEALPFLSEHDEDTFDVNLLSQLKQILLTSTSLKDAVKDAVFLKHFSNVMDALFEQHLGKKVFHMKVSFLQTVNELLTGELSFIQFIENYKLQNSISQISSEEDDNAYALPTSDHQKNSASSQVKENIQNGDLCEADQTRVLNEEIDMEEEEEGAVGGIIERKIESCTAQPTCDIDLNLDFPTNAEGLDQVPTRLPTKVKSRSTTPSKDRSCRSEPDTF